MKRGAVIIGVNNTDNFQILGTAQDAFPMLQSICPPNSSEVAKRKLVLELLLQGLSDGPLYLPECWQLKKRFQFPPRPKIQSNPQKAL